MDDFFTQLFETNFSYVKKKFISNPLLIEKRNLLNESFETFTNKNYAACILTLYPILDYVTRKYFNTNKLDKDITTVNALFRSAGYSLYEIDNLKPGAEAFKIQNAFMWGFLSHDEVNKLRKEKEKTDLGLAGIALSSFLHFGTKYYDYYRTDKKDSNFLNRHAIIHGASNNYDSKINVVKLYTYLNLMLELEPVLKIVFSET